MDASRDGLVPRPRNAAQPKRGSGSRGLTSAYIPAGTVIGVIPQGLAAGYAGIAEIETSTAANWRAVSFVRSMKDILCCCIREKG